MNKISKPNKVSYITKIALLAAMGFVLMYLEFSVPFFAAWPWLKLSISHVPTIIGGLTLGPLGAIGIAVVKNIIFFLVRNSGFAGVGELADLLLGISFALAPALLYKKLRTDKSALFGIIIGAVCMVIAALLLNVFVFLPLLGMGNVNISAYIIQALVPFNLLRVVIEGTISYILFKRLKKVLFSY